MERLKLIDEVRTKALSMMKEDASLSYEEASQKAKIQIVGQDIMITKYQKNMDEELSYVEVAKQELSQEIRIDLYTEEQLKEMIIANRLGVNIEEFMNIFLSPEQIYFLTLASLKGKNLSKYISDLSFDPKEEMQKLVQEENIVVQDDKSGFQKQYKKDAA